MTIPVWPSTLPAKFLTEGFTKGVPDGRLRTAMETGPAKMRRRTRAATTPVTVQFYASLDQVARLEAFWSEDTGGGTLPFLVRDQLRDGQPLSDGTGGILSDEAGNPLTIEGWWLVTFGEQPPQIGLRSGQTARISMALLILP